MIEEAPRPGQNAPVVRVEEDILNVSIISNITQSHSNSHVLTLPGDEQSPCSNCLKSVDHCEYDVEESFIAKQWSPMEQGLGQNGIQLGSSSIQGITSSASTDADDFVSETEAIASHYIIISSPLSSPPKDQPHAPVPSGGLPTQDISHGPATKGISQLNSYVSTPRVDIERTSVIDLHSDLFYLDRYCHVIGPWFDLFDQERNFSLVVPHLSLEHPTLRLSLLACASRQHHLTASSNVNTTLTYYDEALQMLTASMRDQSTSSSAAIFASCLFLAHCEMIGARTQDWHLHISGTYSLIKTHGWHGQSGGLGQACFWVYCRMDLLSSLATGEPTRLDTSLWAQISPALPSDWTINTWANYAVFLLAQVHNFLCKIRRTFSFTPSLFAEWQALGNSIDAHDQNQPTIFRPLVSLPPSGHDLFPSNFYISEAVSAAIQIFDLARLLLILCRPEREHLERMARFQTQSDIAAVYLDRIVANSVVNRHDVNWATAVQLLSSAGYAIAGWRKRKAVLECLVDIQSRTGWNTRDNVTGLLEWWGWAPILYETHKEWRDVIEDIGEGCSPGQMLMRMFEWDLPGKNS